ncbi:MAG: hypothetical protein RI893_1418, partial [Pseudomonadota bacterium]|jgi:hypothetical protein
MKTKFQLPATRQLLVAGGDDRIALDPLSGLNKYGCPPFPDPQLLAFGSSTASVISTESYATADRLREKWQAALANESPDTVYAMEMQALRLEWLELCELSDIPGLELIFSPSGTDTHGTVAQYTASPALIIMVEANETGSGVTSALNQGNNKVVQVSIRQDDGTPRPLTDIDAEVEILASNAVASGRRVLLILVDQSKTGLIAPSPAGTMALHQRYPDKLEVLVDACQFRIGRATLRAYLEQGFMVALTGSKFLAAPSFSALLLLPATVAKRLKKPPLANFSLLLRCALALEELRSFRSLPKAKLIDILLAFTEAIDQRLRSDPHFAALPVPPLDRSPLIAANDWDHLQTIFPFLLYEPRSTGRRLLTREQTLTIYQQLQSPRYTPENNTVASIRCQLGQPVACGTRNSVLRLCLSSRLLVEAVTRGDRGLLLIKNALQALDTTALLIQSGARIT